MKINNLTIATKTITNKATGATTTLISQADAFRLQQSFKKGKVRELSRFIDESFPVKMGDSLFFPLIAKADKRESLTKCEVVLATESVSFPKTKKK